MAEINIDKMLEQNEKREKAIRVKKVVFRVCVSAAIALVLVIAGAITVLLLSGEQGGLYFPVDSKFKYVYNIKGKNPQEWHFLEKKESLYGYECSVLVKSDKATFSTRQEYYCSDKTNGIARLAYSDNYGAKIKDVFVILPYRIKQGKKWNAGTIKDKVITAVIGKQDTIITAAGKADSYRVDYKALPFMDVTVWYSRNMGIVKELNNITAEQTDIISFGE
jgi:hypothetical protein